MQETVRTKRWCRSVEGAKELFQHPSNAGAREPTDLTRKVWLRMEEQQQPLGHEVTLAEKLFAKHLA